MPRANHMVLETEMQVVSSIATYFLYQSNSLLILESEHEHTRDLAIWCQVQGAFVRVKVQLEKKVSVTKWESSHERRSVVPLVLNMKYGVCSF